MRVLIMHTNDSRVQRSVDILRRFLEKEESRVDAISPETVSTAPVSTTVYDLVCVVSEFSGWWKPQIPVEVSNLLKKATRLEGKKGAAFVVSRLWGSTKALRVLMGQMERQGVIVEDFGVLGGESEVVSIAKRLKRLA
ncbi:MAG: hypothetical protein QM401_08175 [Bacillota bacterium]|nr:hypothetical protein [Bacillota bacterium]HHU61033.1 hypothetical protein [Natronincola sp.]